MKCPVCGGKGCGDCTTRGKFKITQDPAKEVGAWAWTVLQIADRYRKGVTPTGGGSLDQSYWINQACEFVDAERSVHLGEYGAMALMFG